MKTLAARVLGRPRGWNLARGPAGSSFVLLSRGRTRYRLEGPSEGPLLLRALLAEDLFVSAAIVLLLGTLTVIGTLLSDILLGILDPRIRMG